jgi:RNA polymerase sigma factor (sigma-70 family)
VLEELNQDVWLSAIDSIEHFDATRGTPQDWLLGIARFKGLTYIRRQYTCRVVSVGRSLPEQIAAPDGAPEDAERTALLRATIESLPEQWQYVLRQKYEVGLSVKEFSELAGVTPKAVE